jgi:peptide/nickel transport system ATP-binding protein
MSENLININNVSKKYGKNQEITVLDNLNFSISTRDIFCVVGESGCGKTTTGKILAGLIEPSQGQVLYQGKNINEMKRREYKQYRRKVQMIHQDPYASLNPTQMVFEIISYPLYKHGIVKTYEQAVNKVKKLLDLVGLTPVEDFINKYPNQLSGGQRQRVSIARILTVNPKFIVVDEATSMIDTSLRVSLLTTLKQLQEEFAVSYYFITHDLALAKYFGWEGRIAVMYLGEIVEIAKTPELINNPLHPYTKALLTAIPEADPNLTRKKERFNLRNTEIPSLNNLPSGCKFHPRCPWFEKGLCDKEKTNIKQIKKTHKIACHIVQKREG